jgi:tRNA(Ile)-lysidine synthase
VRSSPRRPAAPDATELLARCAFPPEGTQVDLAVSGGADSSGLALLAVAAGLRATLHHVDHGLRAGAATEADVVADLAARLGTRFVAHTAAVEPGPNLEARARAARRGTLPVGVLTGHTMDDQAETVLLNLLRGAGLDGLAAMSPSTKPLLGLRRHEVRELVAEAGIPTVLDPSNFDLVLRRNLVRARVLPELSRVAARDLVPVLARQAEIARSVVAYLDGVALAAVPDATDVDALRSAPAVLRRRRLRDLARGGDGMHPPSAAEVDRMEAVVLGDAKGTELAGGRRLARRRGRLHLDED